MNKEIKARKSKYYITSVSLRKVKVTPRNVPVMKHHLENANDESFVLKHLKSLKASKATGLDKINIKLYLVRDASEIIAPSIAKLINRSSKSYISVKLEMFEGDSFV